MKINPTKTVNELLTALSYIIDIEENKNIYHAWRVAILSGQIAKKLVNRQKLKDIFYASLLHDVGAVEFSHHITHYLKRNDKSSRTLLLSHPIIGAQLVSSIPRMNPAAKLILDHHEWVNGKGYPRAKTQKYIPFGSQVIRISDAIDIILRAGRIHNLKELKNKMALNTEKEYSQNLFRRAYSQLKKNRFFYKIYSQRNIPLLFKETKDTLDSIHMPLRVDAIGKTLEVIAQIIDMKDPFMAGHSTRVARYAIGIALAMKLGHDEVTRIRWAGLIHDIGKLTVPRKILDKPTTLTKKEFIQVKKHAAMTAKLLNMVPTLKEITSIASGHHEYFDGSGYPLGLKSEQNPLGARILVVCDAFDAMTSNRPYRRPFILRVACQEIKSGSGSQFDPEVVKYALPLFKNLGL